MVYLVNKGAFQRVMGVPHSWMVQKVENPNRKWMMNRGTPMTSWKPPEMDILWLKQCQKPVMTGNGILTWWFIPLSKWVITPVINSYKWTLPPLFPFITRVVTHLRFVGWTTKQVFPPWLNPQFHPLSAISRLRWHARGPPPRRGTLCVWEITGTFFRGFRGWENQNWSMEDSWMFEIWGFPARKMGVPQARWMVFDNGTMMTIDKNGWFGLGVPLSGNPQMFNGWWLVCFEWIQWWDFWMVYVDLWRRCSWPCQGDMNVWMDDCNGRWRERSDYIIWLVVTGCHEFGIFPEI